MTYSYWETTTIYRHYDTVITGSGFTGLWTALTLREKYPELQILIIEKNSHPLGASTRNAGFACFGSITEILYDAKTMGWTKTLDLIEKRFAGLEKIQKYFPAESFDFELCGGYELLNSEVSDQDIKLVNQKLQPVTGIDHTFSYDTTAGERFGFSSLDQKIIYNPLEGSLHPGKLVDLLIRKCYAEGVSFMWSHALESFENSEDGVKIYAGGKFIYCRKLIFCTNGFTRDLIPELDVEPARGQVLLTSAITGLKLKGVFHSDEGFIYFRNVENRVLLGGMRNMDIETENTSEFSENNFLTQKLHTYLREIILPDQDFEITHRWSGIMAMGGEKSYILKELKENVYCAVRLSGMGVALAPQIAEEVAEFIRF